jgi:hypothetical protein
MLIMIMGALLNSNAWVDRGALGADRLAVAAVDEKAQSRPLEDLWWSGEGQQVLELMDHRACIGRLNQGCLFGTGLPAKAAMAPKRMVQGRKRWDFSRDSHDILALEIVGTEGVLWVWRDRGQPLAAAPALVRSSGNSAQLNPPAHPQPSSSSPWWFWVFAPLVFMIGRWTKRRRAYAVEDDQVLVIEEQLEAERLRHAVERSSALHERDQLRAELRRVKDESLSADVERIAELERALARVRQRWVHLRNDLDQEADVSRRDATRFLAPLQQFAGMLRQIERRMHSVNEVAYAQKIQQRRLGLQGFEQRLRQHFDGNTSFDKRRWQAVREEFDELLEVAKHAQEAATESSRQFHVLRGGR